MTNERTNGLERFHLDVLRGRTRHPSRPVDRDGFLIGSGPDCQLRLGDDEVPEQHCVLHIDDEGLAVERLASAAELLVNEVPVDTARLGDGDVVSIGPFAFVLRDEAVDVETIDPTELSAADLVDLLEDEMQSVDSLEDARREAARELVAAAERTPTEEELLAMTVERLETFSRELDRREERLSEREQRLQDVSEELVGMVAELERRLDALESRGSEQGPLRRAA